jgi:hypothetical protein
MARALAEHTASTDLLYRLEEPFITRADPYDEQRPIESEVLFFGRVDAIRHISQALLQGKHVGLFGLRKVGKTSLLKQIQGRLSAQPRVSIDCQAFEANAIDLFNQILADIRNELRRLGEQSPPKTDPVSGANAFRQQFLRLADEWSKRSVVGRGHVTAGRIILLFDEVDKYFPSRDVSANQSILREYVSLFRVLRGLAQQHRSLAILAIAYRPDINRQNLLTEALGDNPMHMAYQEYFLKYLDEQDTVSMIREVGRLQSIEWEHEAVRLTHILTGGHPLLARQIASEACAKGELKHVQVADVEKVQRNIQSGFHRHPVGRYIDESIWRVLRGDEQSLLSRAAMTSLTKKDVEASCQDALANLLNFGLVAEAADRISIQGSLLETWLRQNEEM